MQFIIIFIIQEPETEAVSDEELPAAQPADLGETESVSDDELPVESEKKRKGKPAKKTSGKKAKSDSSMFVYFIFHSSLKSNLRL